MKTQTAAKEYAYRLTAHRYTQDDAGRVQTNIMSFAAITVLASTMEQLTNAVNAFGVSQRPCNVWVGLSSKGRGIAGDKKYTESSTNLFEGPSERAYTVRFIGRKTGAIGITYEITESVTIPVEDHESKRRDAILVKLYETYEHIGDISITDPTPAVA